MHPDKYSFKPLSSIALYIHFPFCRKKCNYCDFFSVTVYDDDSVRRTLKKTLEQAKYFFSKTGNPSVETVYVGGGTPSLLFGSRLKEFLTSLRRLVAGEPKEWTFEANPESLSAETIRILIDSGISRISIGLQTFNDGLLKLLGRVGDSATNQKTVELVKKLWPGIVNVDLICGIPQQTVESLAADLEIVLRYNPDHISFYDLILEPGTPLSELIRSKTITDLSEDEKENLWLTGVMLLTASGYSHYEISNFARTGKECLHNLKYWEMEPYLGCGPSAVSTLPVEEGVVRIENAAEIGYYIDNLQNSQSSTWELIAPQKFLLEHFIMGLRLQRGITIDKLKRIFSIDPGKVFAGTFARWEENEYLACQDNVLKLTEKGRLILNRLLLDLATEVEKVGLKTPLWPLV
ncbi:MAG: radical SAM family heme chaperone HemW [Spirochaetota bacterium]